MVDYVNGAKYRLVLLPYAQHENQGSVWFYSRTLLWYHYVTSSLIQIWSRLLKHLSVHAVNISPIYNTAQYINSLKINDPATQWCNETTVKTNLFPVLLT